MFPFCIKVSKLPVAKFCYIHYNTIVKFCYEIGMKNNEGRTRRNDQSKAKTRPTGAEK